MTPRHIVCDARDRAMITTTPHSMAGELYVRPPNVIVATAMQRCARGDWEEPDHVWADHLTWLSVYNKMDYARLHGTTLHMKAIWASHQLMARSRGAMV
jgi:hypothetical protein